MPGTPLLPLSGVAFVLILVAVIAFAGDTPTSDAGAQEVFTFSGDWQAPVRVPKEES